MEQGGFCTQRRPHKKRKSGESRGRGARSLGDGTQTKPSTQRAPKEGRARCQRRLRGTQCPVPALRRHRVGWDLPASGAGAQATGPLRSHVAASWGATWPSDRAWGPGQKAERPLLRPRAGPRLRGDRNAGRPPPRLGWGPARPSEKARGRIRALWGWTRGGGEDRGRVCHGGKNRRRTFRLLTVQTALSQLRRCRIIKLNQCHVGKFN